MGMFLKDKEDPTKPLEETPKEEEKKVVNDDFNCGACGGTGLIGEPSAFNNSVCTSCNGTGKVN